MNVQSEVNRDEKTAQDVGIYDCDIHPMLRSGAAIREYLPVEWREFAVQYMDFVRSPFMGATRYPKSSPALSRRDSWPPAGGPPGSDLSFMQKQHLDVHNIECGILQPLFPNASKQRNLDFAEVMCTAVNRWQEAEWTSKEPRLKGSIVVPQEDGDAAAAEVDRWAQHPDFAQIMLSPRTDEALGRRRYWPIYEAAVKHNIPIGIHVGGANGLPSTSAGHPSFHIEDYQGHIQTMQALVSSLVLEGVFERFPNLRIVLIEAGVGWLPSVTWRLDKIWQRMRSEVPHVKRPPSEYIKQNLWLTTQPIDEPEKPEQQRDILDWVGWDRILFATDYPHWDSDDPKYIFKCKLSPTERLGVFRDNARNFYRRAH